MSWLVVAGKDFREAIRARLVRAFSAAFVVAAVAIAVGYALVEPGSGFDELLSLLGEFVAWLVPVAGLVVGFKAVVGERESGTLKLLLSLPHTRGDVVLGKVLGRTAAIAGPVLLGLVVAGLLALVLYPGGSLARSVAFAVLSALLGLAFVSLAVAVSAVARSTVRAASGATAAFVAFLFLWEPALDGLYAFGAAPGGGRPPGWYLFLQHLNPVGAYRALAGSSSTAAGSIAVLLLGLWVVVPLAIGYYRFRETELT